MKTRSIVTLHFAATILLLMLSSQILFAQQPQDGITLPANTSEYYHTAGIVLDDGAGNTITILPPAGGAGIAFPFPSNTPNNGDVITSDGTGGVSWHAPAGGGFTPAFFNAYTTNVPFTIAPGVVVPVTTIATNSGFIADPFSGFTVVAAGTYNVEYTVTRDEPSAFAITVDGIVAPNSVFGCATGTSVVHGNAFLTLVVGDVIRLIAASTNSSAVTLEPFAPFSSVEASLTAVRIQ
jgi:hypothetical protein